MNAKSFPKLPYSFLFPTKAKSPQTQPYQGFTDFQLYLSNF
ncbi:hypothetical protein B4098_3441 [Heyndrickxia coagulans]|uniref:Uncharacterized protein n=1 Tax=Heyndrickxia coagulans TaxID=1398 RepID=A0A150JWI0_HEYCO|nr:hypothetical protein B4098_3441 [Heyndrickxia coagulans]